MRKDHELAAARGSMVALRLCRVLHARRPVAGAGGGAVLSRTELARRAAGLTVLPGGAATLCDCTLTANAGAAVRLVRGGAIALAYNAPAGTRSARRPRPRSARRARRAAPAAAAPAAAAPARLPPSIPPPSTPLSTPLQRRGARGPS